jgi:predicted TIM-barrel fold metal-dependent hydrolase
MNPSGTPGLTCYGCGLTGFSYAPMNAAMAGSSTRKSVKSSSASGKPRAKSKNAPHRIDVHHHHASPRYMAELAAFEGGPHPKRQGWTPARSIEQMDANGIATAITSISSPGVWWGDELTKAAGRARDGNEYAAQMARDFPGRFGFFAAIPLPDIDASLSEIEYAYDVLGADGIGLLTNIGDSWLGDPAFAPVMDELHRRKAVIYTHPTAPSFCENLLPGVLDSVIEYGTDTTRTIISLLLSGTAARCPDIRFIFSHGGGTMPYLLERFTRLFAQPHMAASVPRGVLHELKRFYYEVAQIEHPGAIFCLRELAPLSHILFGTDFPYRLPRDILAGLKRCGFTEREWLAMGRNNALRLFPRLK